MPPYLIDDVDFRILQYLIEDSTLSHKEIGRQVHMTGQAIGARIRRMQDTGIIEGYTVRWNADKIGLPIHALVTVFLTSNAAHSAFLNFVREADEIAETQRVSGEGCYWMRVRAASQEELNSLLDKLLEFGNYKVSQAIGRIK